MLVGKIVRIVAREVLNLAISLEDEEVVYDLVHEVAVVRDDHQAAFVVEQELLEDVEGDDVQVVGRLARHR